MTSRSDETALTTEIERAARRRGAARALVLDFDGTLVPIADHPSDVRVPAAVSEALRRLLLGGWRVAIVSGRPADDVRRLMPIAGVAVFGSHGIEKSGARTASRALRLLAARAARIARDARAWTRDIPGVAVELKPFGCAFHDRALEAKTRPQFRRRLSVWLATHDTRGFDLLRGKCVVELRPAGLGKELVARRWAPARTARPGDRSLVAIGDDRTDEDLFAALDGRGLTVCVGASRRRTLARRRLSGTAAVTRLLAGLAAAARPGITA
jgi:trehalose-phosphatase